MNQQPLPDPANILVQSSSTPDDSLEEALFDDRPSEETTSRAAEGLPSPRLSTIMVDNSREVGVKPSTSSLKAAEKNNKRRGLTVSFVQEEAASKPGSASKRRLIRHSTQRNLDESLANSFNSPFGDLEQRYAIARKGKKEGVFQRLVTGSDPRLGYDWIAGLLDASGPSLSERDNDYFSELNEFRKVNYEECHGPKRTL